MPGSVVLRPNAQLCVFVLIDRVYLRAARARECSETLVAVCRVSQGDVARGAARSCVNGAKPQAELNRPGGVEAAPPCFYSQCAVQWGAQTACNCLRSVHMSEPDGCTVLRCNRGWTHVQPSVSYTRTDKQGSYFAKGRAIVGCNGPRKARFHLQTKVSARWAVQVLIREITLKSAR